MVKYTVCDDRPLFKREITKFTRELNTYGVDENGIGEELLFPIRLNGEPGENQETNLATYLIKYKEFEKTDVKITGIQDKEGFLILTYWNKSIDFNFATILTPTLASGLCDSQGTVSVNWLLCCRKFCSRMNFNLKIAYLVKISCKCI